MKDTRENILLAAYQLFIENGYHNTSMQQLVVKSGLSKGAFYHYFKNKRDIYLHVIDEFFLSFYKEIDWELLRTEDLAITQIEEQIKSFYLNLVPKILSITPNGFGRYFIMYFEAYELHPEFKEVILSFYHQLEKLILSSLKDVPDSKQVATTMIAKYEGLLFLLAINPDYEIGQLLDQVIVEKLS